MKYLTVFAKFLFALAISIGCSSLKGQDIALHKSYTLSPDPNSPHRTTQNSLLTDGVNWNGSDFWTRPTTLGWVKVPQVSISVDLGKIEKVGAASFNTCQLVDSVFNIRFPDHIYIFLSTDNQHFLFAGDATKGYANVPGPYSIHKFTLDSIDADARFIKFVVIPHGFFVFCDEITVEKDKGYRNRRLSVLTNTLDSAVDSLVSGDFNRRYLQRVHTGALDNAESSQNISIRFVSPWDSLGPYLVADSKKNGSDSAQFVVPEGGSVYGAIKVINATGSKKDFYIETSFSHPGMDSLETFIAAFVPAAGYTMVPDALIPLSRKAEELENGQQKMILFKIIGLRGGNANAEISVHSGKYIDRLHFSIKTLHINDFNKFKLNANVWFNDYHPMVRDRRENAFNDLEKHHVNSLLIGSGYLSPLNKPSFSKLISFLSEARFAGKLLVSTEFTNPVYREPDPEAPFMSPLWKKEFVEWYDSLLKVIGQGGFSSSQVYFYPYDEVRGKDIRDFILFASWIKTSVPEVQLYATITKSIIDSTEGFNELLPLLDIAQVGSNPPIILPNLPKHTGQIWVYENNGKSRAASPYGFYRLMAWDAYLKDVTGIGFWSYTGDPRIKKVTDAFRDLNMDYGVVYDGLGKTIISSRRWEGFSLGIEDYQVLYLYGKKYGVTKAKSFARQVMAHPGDTMLADKIKNQMVLSLAGNNQ